MDNLVHIESPLRPHPLDLEKEYARIWDTLSKIDVSAHIEKKQGLSYLSWAWAWGVLMAHFPHAQYEFDAPIQNTHDGTLEVRCTVRIGLCHRTMWLPVMDHRNNAISNPDMRKVSDTKMRCLVKCLAMFGLGHYIYAGEDLPPSASDDGAHPETAVVEDAGSIQEPPQKRKKATPTKSNGNDIPTEEGAVEVVDKLIEFANKFCTDEKGLVSFWKENKKLIDIIDSNYPTQYERLKQSFTTLKSKFGENANG